MSELETLQALNAQTNLIRSIADKDQQLLNVGEFTRRAAYALRDLGYGNVRKTSGTNVRGLSADVIMRRSDGAAFDIVVGKQTDSPSVAFNSSPTLDPAQFFVAPQPEPDQAPAPGPIPPPPPPPPPAPPDVPPTITIAGIDQLIAQVTRGADALTTIADELKALNALAVKVKF